MLARFKPGASIRMHLVVAAGIWATAGGMLIWRGLTQLDLAQKLWLAAPALLIGTVKSLLVLDRSARRNLDRILLRRDGSCLGGVYSIGMWVMIAAMMLVGRLLRQSGVAPEITGVVFTGIGWGLFFSSRVLWGGWARHRAAGR